MPESLRRIQLEMCREMLTRIVARDGSTDTRILLNTLRKCSRPALDLIEAALEEAVVVALEPQAEDVTQAWVRCGESTAVPLFHPEVPDDVRRKVLRALGVEV